VAQQGDIPRAMKLWEESLKILEQIGDVQGKAATLSNMAGVVAQQGDIPRAMKLWEESLKILEQIGDVQGKAATLNNMAGVVAQQGDIPRAMKLWEESLKIQEQIGDVKGKAVTLNNMAWAAGKTGDHATALKLNLEAAAALAAARAFTDLVTVLGNLGSDEGTGTPYLAQALWLSLRIEVPLAEAVAMWAALLQRVTPVAPAGLLVAATALFLTHTRGEADPSRGKMQEYAIGMLGACAESRDIRPERFTEWVASEKLNDPNYVLPAFDNLLTALVGENPWLFDRSLFTRSKDAG